MLVEDVVGCIEFIGYQQIWCGPTGRLCGINKHTVFEQNCSEILNVENSYASPIMNANYNFKEEIEFRIKSYGEGYFK